MKKLILTIIIGFMYIGCSGSSKHWNLEMHYKTKKWFIEDKTNPDKLLEEVRTNLEKKFERWDIKFTVNDKEGATLQFWEGPLNRRSTMVGLSIPGANYLGMRTMTGVFVNDSLKSSIASLPISTQARALANIAAHEIGHVYFLKHQDNTSLIMRGSIMLFDDLEWSESDIEHLDKLLAK